MNEIRVGKKSKKILIDCQKNKKNGLTLAEMLVVILIISIIAAAILPLMVKHHRKITQKAAHGSWECYYEGGQLYTKMITDQNTVKTAVTTCTFSPPKNVEYFIIEAVGGGGGGGGTAYNIDGTYKINGSRFSSSAPYEESVTSPPNNPMAGLTNPFSSYGVSDSNFRLLFENFPFAVKMRGGGGGGSVSSSSYIPSGNGGSGGFCYWEYHIQAGDTIYTLGGTGGDAGTTNNGYAGKDGNDMTLQVSGSTVLRGTGGKGGLVGASGSDGTCSSSVGTTSSNSSMYDPSNSTAGSGGSGAAYPASSASAGHSGNVIRGFKIYRTDGVFEMDDTLKADFYPYSKKYISYGNGGKAGQFGTVMLNSIPSTITITVGAPGKAGAKDAASLDVAQGTKGGATYFGSFLTLLGGDGGTATYSEVALDGSAINKKGDDAGVSAFTSVYGDPYGSGGIGGSTIANNNVVGYKIYGYSNLLGSCQFANPTQFANLLAADTYSTTSSGDGGSGAVLIVW